MHLTSLSLEDYAQFYHSRERAFFTQSPEYGQVRLRAGHRVERVGLVDGTKIVAAATIVYQPWKRFFRRAHVPYGPIVDWENHRLVEEFFSKLLAWVKRDRAVLSLRVNPLLTKRDYTDVTPGELNADAQHFESMVLKLGGEPVLSSLYGGGEILVQFAYVKNLEGMDYAQAAASCGQVVRTGFNRKGSNGVEVRFLGPQDIGALQDVLQHTSERTGMEAITSSAIAYYQALMAELGSDQAFMPVAVLNCRNALSSIRMEKTQAAEKLAELRKLEQQTEESGRVLGRKQRNQINEIASRLDVLNRRENETSAIQAEHGDEVVLAASLFIASPGELVYLVSGAYAEFQSYYGIYLIHRAMFEWAAENGIKWYNTFGISGDFTDTAPDAGVLHFKRQFAGSVEEYVGTFDFLFRPRLARLLGADAQTTRRLND